ncbi:hypothetical protein D3C86_1801960 [compost metagenome]
MHEERITDSHVASDHNIGFFPLGDHKFLVFEIEEASFRRFIRLSLFEQSSEIKTICLILFGQHYHLHRKNLHVPIKVVGITQKRTVQKSGKFSGRGAAR